MPPPPGSAPVHSEHQVNTESFWALFTLSCTHATKEASRFWGCGQFLPFIIKHIWVLGIVGGCNVVATEYGRYSLSCMQKL